MGFRQLASILVLLVPGAPPINAASVDMEQIKAVWQDRQSKLKSVKVEYRFVEILPRGANTPPILAAYTKKEVTKVQPPRDYEVTGTGSLLSNRTTTKIILEGSRWSVTHERLYPYKITESISGKLRSLSEPESLAQFYPRGRIRPTDDSSIVHYLGIQPLLINFGLGLDNKKHYFHLDRWEVTGRQVSVNNLACVELRKASSNQAFVQNVYLAKDRGYLPVRQSIMNDGKQTYLANFSYETEPTIGWRLDRWDYVFRRNTGELIESANFVLTLHEINPTFSEADLQVEFPVGTSVLDSTSGQEMQYVVKEGGAVSKAVSITARLTYEELLRVPTAQSYPDLTWGWLLAGGVVIFVCCVVFCSWCRFRKLAE